MYSIFFTFLMNYRSAYIDDVAFVLGGVCVTIVIID